MPVVCDLHPLKDATTDQLKSLGLAIREWAGRELGLGILLSIDQDGLASLLLGEPPNPLGAQVASNQPGVPMERILRELGPLASDRSLRFTVKDEPDCTRDMVIASLRQAIPAELVEDIVIDDEGWTQ